MRSRILRSGGQKIHMAEEPKTELEKSLRALLLVNLEPLKQKQQITILDKAGFGQSEIAVVVGSTPKAVSVRLSEIRKKTRKGKSQGGELCDGQRYSGSNSSNPARLAHFSNGRQGCSPNSDSRSGRTGHEPSRSDRKAGEEVFEIGGIKYG